MKKLNRKEFLFKGALGAAGAMLASSCNQSEGNLVSKAASINIKNNPTLEWKMVTTWPPNFPVLGEGCNLMARWVEEMSGGRLRIRVYGGGELVPALEAFDAVSMGAAEMGNGAAYYWAGKLPAAQFFAAVPFGMNAQQMNAWILCGGGLELWHKLYAPFNLISFPSGNTGVQMGGWFNRRIDKIEDLRGLKIRMPGLGGKVVSRAGATAVNVAGSEIYLNLERGVIDATEWIGPYHDYSMGFHRIAKYYYYPGWHEPGSTLETFINRDRFQELPPDLQEILKAAIHRQNVWTLSEFEARNGFYLDKLIREEDVELLAWPKEVLKVLREHTREVLQEIAAADPDSARIYSAYSDFQDKAQTWAQVTEKAYHQMLKPAEV